MPLSPHDVAVLPAATDAQAGLWFAQRLDPKNPVFNTAQYLELVGPIDVDRLAAAVAQAMHEADGLRLAFVDHAEGPRWRGEATAVGLEVVECRAAADPIAAALSAMQRDLTHPLDLEHDALVAQRLFVVGADHHLWYQRVHHAVIDGYGTALLTRRIADLYGALGSGGVAATRPFTPFAQLITEDAAYAASPAKDLDRAYWHALFADRPEVVGLADGPTLTAYSYRRAEAALGDAAGERLVALADEVGVSWPDILVALTGACLQRHTGRPEAIVGVPSMLRVGSVAARIPAMVMNVLPVRVPDADATTLRPFLTGVAMQLREARRHGRYRSEQVRRDLGLLSEQRRLYGPLVNVLPFDAVPRLPGVSSRLEVLATGPVDDLTITFRADAEGRQLRLELDANPRLYDGASVAAFAVRLAAFVEAALATGDLRLVPTVTVEEQTRYVHDVNATGHRVADVTLTDLLEDTMRRQPSADALEFEGTTLTYGVVDARTAHLARRLAAAGARPGAYVAVCLPRSLDLEIAIVAVLRAGAAYVPIDTDTPPERLRTLVTAAQPVVTLTSRALAAAFDGVAPVICVDALDWQEPLDATPLPIAAGLDAAAYVIFTSGSTGAPKGVVVEHRAIVNRLEWMRVHYGVTAADRILQKTPVTFDVSVWELFLPLVAGGVLVMAPPDAHRDPVWLARLLRDARITTAHFVPSMLAQFLAEPKAAGLTMARVFVSGEALPAALRDRFHAVMHAELHNLYGPTEAAVDVTWWDAGPHDTSTLVPIGRPVWNTQMYVLDGRLRPVPPGVAGTLYIGGVQLAREYLGRPDLTAERFIPNPFGAPGTRIYDTGDVARWRRDGVLEFLGRTDHQVKIRGQRIEPGEIEAALIGDDVAQAVVIARERHGDRQLVGYLVARSGHVIDVEEVRATLGRRLPPAMVPAALVVVEALPLNSSGKLDRARLPQPELTATSAAGRPLTTASERQLAAIVADVLQLPADLAPGADSDFFALGGHSLSAAQVMRRVRETWHCDLALGVLFAHPTIAALAAAIDGAADGGPRTMEANGLGVLVRLTPGATPPLFCVHPAGGIAWCYSALARALQPAREVFGVQARALDLTSPMPATLEAMADDYVAAIRRQQADGPYHLAGWSVGGIIAHAMAAALEAQGQRVATLALLDAYPSDRWRDQAPPDEGAAWNALLLIAGVEATAVGEGAGRDAVLQALRASGHPLGNLPDAVLEGVLRVVAHNSRLVRGHHHRPVAVPILHFRAALDHQGSDLSPLDWRPYTSAVEVCDIASRHPQMISVEASRQIAGVLAPRGRP